MSPIDEIRWKSWKANGDPRYHEAMRNDLLAVLLSIAIVIGASFLSSIGPPQNPDLACYMFRADMIPHGCP
jgi:hypothetical protein